MHGLATTRAGNPVAGQRRLDDASLMIFDDPNARYELAMALSRRDRREEAKAQWEIVARTAAVNSRLVANSSRRLGNAISASDPLGAASRWQLMLLGTLKPTDSLPEVSDYLAIAHLIHRLRARALLEAEQTADAYREARRAVELLPGQTAAVCDLVERFDACGATEQADALFSLSAEHFKGILKRHPKATHLRGQLTEMAQACNRSGDK
jgi:thioredoxin-like negative regulator of GroEL